MVAMVECTRPECQTTAGCICQNPTGPIAMLSNAMSRLAQLEAENAELRREVDYWKTEAAGETAKVEYRDKLLARVARQLAEFKQEAAEVVGLFADAAETAAKLRDLHNVNEFVLSFNDIAVGVMPTAVFIDARTFLIKLQTKDAPE